MAQDVYPPLDEQPVAQGGQCIVSPTQPVGVGGMYLWVQTKAGPFGADITMWVEDGT